MSALLTTTMPYMKVVIDTLAEKGLRDTYIVLVGGAPLNEEFGRPIGADAYCRDAAVAAETAKSLVSARRDLRDGRAARTVGGLTQRHDRAMTVTAARHRLRRAGRRAARRARRRAGWTTRSRSATCRPTSTTGRSGSCPALEAALADETGERPVLVAYADCGTGGALDRFVAGRPNAARLPGAHCYEVFAGAELFAALHDAEPGTFYLTDFLAKHFDRARVAGARARPASRAARRVLRQLPAGRAAVAVRRSRPSSRPAGRPPSDSGSSSSTVTSGAAVSPTAVGVVVSRRVA